MIVRWLLGSEYHRLSQFTKICILFWDVYHLKSGNLEFRYPNHKPDNGRYLYLNLTSLCSLPVAIFEFTCNCTCFKLYNICVVHVVCNDFSFIKLNNNGSTKRVFSSTMYWYLLDISSTNLLYCYNSRSLE